MTKHGIQPPLFFHNTVTHISHYFQIVHLLYHYNFYLNTGITWMVPLHLQNTSHPIHGALKEPHMASTTPLKIYKYSNAY
jgi:hypothetical protein